ncbi:MAG: nucleotide exchange factor GrpE [Euryarchaeota archaeon]|jgi:molecular chaperone GrpE|nr:nucleotide exchange factor GrpE [Euryarchaeota archaeon]|tara:strand:+ start:446 stop:961 length:516 start_codon:yes stop_codon:yes gene_type:complete
MSEEPESDAPLEEDVEEEESADPLQTMESRVLELEKELQYSVAEIVNIRQRSIRDKNDAVKYGGANLASRLIPIIDNLSRAIESSGDEEISESIFEGVKLTLESMSAALSIEGVKKIEISESSFDPTCMEAIASIPCPEGEEPGKIFQVIEDGYKLHDRVLRATKVIVYEG